MRIRHFVSGLVLALLSVTVSGIASQPIRFNYQAKLTDTAGNALSGSHTLFLGLFYGGSAATPDSGTLVYSESVNVSITEGVVNHIFGTGTPTSGILNDAALASDTDYHLQVAVDTQSNIILPRTLIGNVPFAARARSADTALTAISAQNGAVTGQLLFSTSATPPAGYTTSTLRFYNPWIMLSNIGTARSEVELAAAQNTIFSIGGYNAGEKGDVNMFLPASGFTGLASPLLVARYYHRATTINDTVYVTGGLGAGGNPLASTEYLAPSSSWAVRQSMQTVRAIHAAAVCNGLLYVFGGFSTGLAKTSTAEVYNPTTNTWSYIVNLPLPLAGLGAATIGNKIYIMGDGNLHYEYDTLTFTYTPRAPMPYNNSSNKAHPIAYDGKIYLVGSAGLTPQAFVYDPVTNTWDRAPSSLVGAVNPGACLFDGTIYLGGGGLGGASKEARLESWKPPILFGHTKN